ncbi:MAG: hypothetical protein IPM31_10350 [Anaerolineae bacterium]|nr:hypothetical protein [Anaerolineae bacterium]MBL8104158.1 hypothetical protein [Anaerolineales bacterium]MCC7189053.1 hypothetical protein [Anaerolineales bacterium]HQU35461.1 hypothetical protein [Anaerolineales bacterium]
MPALPFNVRRVATIIGIVALVFIVLEFNRRLEEMNLLNKQYQLVQQQATQAVQTQTALQTQVAFAASDGAVDEWARTDGHYVQEGDLPVVPLGQPGAAPVELSTPAPTATPMTNMQIWWDLFFGEH